MRSQSFDTDPKWEGINNHIDLGKAPMVTQDFGWSDTNHAGKTKGEMGGHITRSSQPCYYAAEIAPVTLEQKLSMSGSFSITKTGSGGGVSFGFFSSDQPAGMGRPVNSFSLDFDSERSGGRLAVRLISASNQSCGSFITLYEPGKRRPTPIKNDGTRYHWTLTYDPDASAGRGQFQCVLTSDSKTPDDFEGKPVIVDLPDGFRKPGATFNRFGLMNGLKAGGAMEIYFDDLKFNDRAETFDKDPNWAASQNRATFEEPLRVGAHNFGFSDTNYAGGKAGEVGGDFWRCATFASYGDSIAPLTLNDELHATGKIVLRAAGPDADMYIGWFSRNTKDESPAKVGGFIGVQVGGPTRTGHMFTPMAMVKEGSGSRGERGPVLVPGKPYSFDIHYDPAGNDNAGEITVTLGDDTVKLPLKAGLRKADVSLDRFGLFTATAGGQVVRICLDDLQYSARDSK